VRLFWKLEDILIDQPKATEILAQLMASFILKRIISSRIISQIPEEVREKLSQFDAFQ